MRLVLLVLVFCVVRLYAHSGRTDSGGGHYNRSTGEYHFHSGIHAGRAQFAPIKKRKSEGTIWLPIIIVLVIVGWFISGATGKSAPENHLSSPPVPGTHRQTDSTQYRPVKLESTPPAPSYPPKQITQVSDYYYLSSSGTRHNRRCRYYRSGRPCSATSGVRCRICGG